MIEETENELLIDNIWTQIQTEFKKAKAIAKKEMNEDKTWEE